MKMSEYLPCKSRIDLIGFNNDVEDTAEPWGTDTALAVDAKTHTTERTATARRRVEAESDDDNDDDDVIVSCVCVCGSAGRACFVLCA